MEITELSDFTHEIHIKGARTNNLKNVDLRLPKNKLIVVTGVSGSGKSSLVMDVIYAEGQRRYVESLSSYARQFLARMKKPDVDFITGLSPAIAIEQKVVGGSSRSTVGTMTEIYDYLRMLYARVGRTFSPISGKEVRKENVSDVLDFIKTIDASTRILIHIPLHKLTNRTLEDELKYMQEKGFPRLMFKKEIKDIGDFLENPEIDLKKVLSDDGVDDVNILIDRVVTGNEKENLDRIADSVQIAFNEGGGICRISIVEGKTIEFNNRFEIDGLTFIQPNPQLFNFNNSFGACKKCEGYSKIIGIDPTKVIPDDSKSIFEGAVACWHGEKYGEWKEHLVMHSDFYKFPIHKPVAELDKSQYEFLWHGNSHFGGIFGFFKEIEAQTYKIQNRVMLSRYRGRTTCDECGGGRLRKEAGYVKIAGKNIMELVEIPIDDLYEFFKELKLSEHDTKIASRLLIEIKARLMTMNNVGLGYLTLNRLSNTLSGGETQRINLTRILGSNLTNSIYILDEPSIGLHPKDIMKLVTVLENLRNMNNTVIVVEHEENIISQADHIVDIGPMAGIHGGNIEFSGSISDFKINEGNNLTSLYFTGRKRVMAEHDQRKIFGNLIFKNCRKNNLKGFTVKIPINTLSVITGVSGSGKSTLVKEIIIPNMEQYLNNGEVNIAHMEGDFKTINKLEFVDQKPIGKSSRSNPVTYVKAFDHIRKIFANEKLSKLKGLTPGHFSFNTEGGRCETCNGEGEINVEMQFLSDIKLICDECGGKRYKKDVLEVTYRGKNIYDVLEMTIEEAMIFFNDHKEITKRLEALNDVGLSYIRLGQSSSTISGGEAQRIKLASFISKKDDNEHILFIFDEPTTGLHYDDISKLLKSLNSLVEMGHTIIVIEHNLDMIKEADWVIDLGPGGGVHGGQLIFQGRIADIKECPDSFTGQYLRERNV